ncbi:MAG: hypothetical protein GTO60_16680 [Gammaproteobacteria bacterium]|nr:hypothetical protein [Gammaproteobacteria bacterium]
MSIVSAGDQTKYNNAAIAVVNPVLNLEPLNELATAEVVAAPSYPMVSMTITNVSANWGQVTDNLLFRIEQPGGTIVAWGVTRFAATATVFYPDVKSAGDFGYATNSGITVSSGDIIRIYRNRHIWAMISRVGGNGQQFKRWSQAYNGEGRRPPPVANLGVDRTAYVDPTTLVASFTFDASNSFDWRGIGIATYSWALPSGATVTAGAIDEASVTFDIAAGIYQVSCTIRSNNGATATGTRTIYVNDRSSNLSFGERFGINAIQGDTLDQDGWRGQFTISGDLTNEIYPGQKCLWFTPVEYDGDRLLDNAVFIDSHVGYLTNYSLSYDGNGVATTTLIFDSPLKATKLLPSATQFIEEASSPSAWTEVRPGLSHPAYAAFYILKYHTTVLDSHDMYYDSAIANLRRRVFGFGSDTIQSHLEIIGVIMSGKVACRANGSLNLYLDPNLQDVAGRNARDQKYTWTKDNLKAPLQMNPRLRPDIAYLIMRAVFFDGDTQAPAKLFASKAPGRAQMQGVTKTDLPDISLATNNAGELYRIVGHWVAKLNNPLDRLVLQPHAMLEIFEPADPDWHIINLNDATYIPVDLNRFGIRWSNAVKYLPEQVTRQWVNDPVSGWTKSVRVTGRIESAGQPGVFHPTYRGESAPYVPPSGWVDGIDITMPDLSPEFNFNIDLPSGQGGQIGYEFGWVYNDLGASSVSLDWNGDFPEWQSASVNLSGNVIDQVLDADNNGAGYMVVYDAGANELIIYYNSDIGADVTGWTAQVIIDVTGIGFHGRARIANNTSLTILAVLTETRVLVYRKPSGGSWGSATTVGDVAAADPDGAQLEFGIDIEGSTQVVPGRESTNDGYLVYKATTSGGSFTAIANTPGDAGSSITPFPMLARDGSSNTLITFGQLDDTLPGETVNMVPFFANDRPSFPDRDPQTGAWNEEWWGRKSDETNLLNVPAIYGWAVIRPSNEQLTGITYEVSSFTWDCTVTSWWFTATGNEPSVDFLTEGRLIDTKGNVLWSSGEIATNNQDWADVGSGTVGDKTLQSRQTQLGFDELKGVPDTPIFNVAGIEILIYTTTLQTFGATGVYAEFEVEEFRPIEQVADSKTGAGGRVYSVDDSTETWTDITPYTETGGIRTPNRHNAVAIASGDIYAMVTDEDGGRFFVSSSDGGTTWDEIDSTSYLWIRSLGGNKFAVGGDERLAVSLNGLSSFTRRQQQLSKLGSTGEIQDFQSGGTL